MRKAAGLLLLAALLALLAPSPAHAYIGPGAGFALAGSRAALYAAAVIFSVGSGILHPALLAIHVESISPEERGRATAGFYLGFDLGVGLGAWVLSPAFQWYGLTGLYQLAAAGAAVGILLVRPMRAWMRQIAHAGTGGSASGSS